MPLERDAEARYYESRQFDEAHAREVRQHYLQYVEGRDLLVELGCGRGEFLTLARDVVTRVRGVDIDPEMVRVARAAGLDVVEASAADYVATTDDRPDALFAAHLVEHLTVDGTYDLLTRVAGILRPGGVVIIVTPNPACLAMLTADFWSDPTHVRPYTLELLEYLVGEAGLSVVAKGGNPNDVPGPPPQLLAADLLEPWGSLLATLPDSPVLEKKGRDPVALLGAELSRLRHVLMVLEERVFALRHATTHIGDRLNATLQFLYPANEIFVVAQKPA